jgi:hypothetical protein
MVAVLIRAFERCDAEECDEKLKTTLDVTVKEQEWEGAPEELGLRMVSKCIICY